MKNINIHSESVKNIDPTIIANGFNSCISIEIPGRVITGGTLRERCEITKSDVDMADHIRMTNIDHVLEVSEEEEVTLHIMEDIILLWSDVTFSGSVDCSWGLPIDTDLSALEGVEGIEIDDLR